MPGRATNEPTNYFAFGFQSAKDTEATTFYHLKHLDGTGFDVEDEVQAEREGGDGQEIGFRYRSQIHGDGAMVANARVDFAARMLAAIQGKDVASGIITGATSTEPITRHTAEPAPTSPYLTVDQFWADVTERSTNCKMTQLEIEWEAGRPFKFTGQFISGGTVYRRVTTLTPTRETGKPIMYPGASITLDGAANAKMTKGKITIKREIADDIYTTALSREDTVETAYDVDVEGTLKYEDKTLYQRAKYGGGTQVPVDLATMSIDIFSLRGSNSLRMVAPGLEVADSKVNRLEPGGEVMYLDFSAMSVKQQGAGATHSFFSEVVNLATVAYF